jgi:hypothetical protein
MVAQAGASSHWTGAQQGLTLEHMQYPVLGLQGKPNASQQIAILE